MERDNQHYPLATHAEREFEIVVDRLEIPHISNLGGVRPPTNLAPHFFELFLRSGGRDLDGTILSISDPASESQSPARNSRKPPEADPLHPARYQEMHRRHDGSAAHSEQHRESSSHRCFRRSAVEVVDDELACSNSMGDAIERISDFVCSGSVG